MKVYWMVLVVAACGAPAHETEPHVGKLPDPPAETHGEQAKTMVSPESLDDLTRAFRGKQPMVGNCYGDLVAKKKIDHKARGRITLEMTVTTGGQAQDVHATNDTLNSPELESCVITLVQKWPLPPPNVQTSFSFSYEFQPD